MDEIKNIIYTFNIIRFYQGEKALETLQERHGIVSAGDVKRILNTDNAEIKDLCKKVLSGSSNINWEAINGTFSITINGLKTGSN